jgi:hypothetical protein
MTDRIFGSASVSEARSSSSGGAISGTPADEKSLFDAYLDQASARMVGFVSREERREFRAAVMEELTALSQAYRELGLTSEEAVAAVTQRFGDPSRIAADWMKERRRSLFGCAESPLVSALKIFAPFFLIGIWVLMHVCFSSAGNSQWGIDAWKELGLPFGAMLLMLPLAPGFLVGSRHPGKSPMGVVGAISLFLLATGLMLPSLIQWDDPFAYLKALLIVSVFLWWLPGGTVAALLGREARRWAATAWDQSLKTPKTHG